MHDTSLASGNFFLDVYGSKNKIVLDIGGKNMNGSLRLFFEEKEMKYICLDMEEDESVDVVIKPGDKLPFDDGSIDLIVSTSCFEHDPCFWITFKEMTRVVKKGGFIYVSAPSNGPYHNCPGDNWRFYIDAGQALSYWSSFQIANEKVFPVKIVESFHITPKNDIWIDFVCVWERVDEKQTDILISNSVLENIGILEKTLHDNGFNTIKKIM
jgi:SAM-dependent methyltransferase